MVHHYGSKTISHILDDFIFIGPSNSLDCAVALDNFLAQAGEAGIPIQQSKTCRPNTTIIVHGIQID